MDSTATPADRTSLGDVPEWSNSAVTALAANVTKAALAAGGIATTRQVLAGTGLLPTTETTVAVRSALRIASRLGWVRSETAGADDVCGRCWLVTDAGRAALGEPSGEHAPLVLAMVAAGYLVNWLEMMATNTPTTSDVTGRYEAAAEHLAAVAAGLARGAVDCGATTTRSAFLSLVGEHFDATLRAS